jgi:hypothetical protein
LGSSISSHCTSLIISKACRPVMKGQPSSSTWLQSASC